MFLSAGPLVNGTPGVDRIALPGAGADAVLGQGSGSVLGGAGADSVASDGGAGRISTVGGSDSIASDGGDDTLNGGSPATDIAGLSASDVFSLDVANVNGAPTMDPSEPEAGSVPGENTGSFTATGLFSFALLSFSGAVSTRGTFGAAVTQATGGTDGAPDLPDHGRGPHPPR